MSEYRYVLVFNRGWLLLYGFFRVYCCFREGNDNDVITGIWGLWDLDG